MIMEKFIKMLFDVFQVIFVVFIQMCLDGGVLLILCNGEEIVICCVVFVVQLVDEKCMYWFINVVCCDLVLEVGSLLVDVVGILCCLQECGLLSYMVG